jgi:hypothetical protein
VLLKISTPRTSGRLAVRVGECGRFAAAGSQPVVLCVRTGGHGLLLDIADSQTPSSGAATPAWKTTLVLEPNAEVRVAGPFYFDVEWIREAGPDSIRPPSSGK